MPLTYGYWSMKKSLTGAHEATCLGMNIIIALAFPLHMLAMYSTISKS